MLQVDRTTAGSFSEGAVTEPLQVMQGPDLVGKPLDVASANNPAHDPRVPGLRRGTRTPQHR